MPAAAPGTMVMPDGSYADRPRQEPRLRIRVLARVDCILPGGAYVRRGHDDVTGKPAAAPVPQEVVIYASDLPKVEALVEDQLDAFKHAEKAFEAQYYHWLQKKTNDKVVAEDKAGRPNNRFNRQTTGLSVEKCFFENVGRGIRPLLKVEVLEHMAPPEVPRAMGADGSTLGIDSDVLSQLIEQRVAEEVKKALSKGGRKG